MEETLYSKNGEPPVGSRKVTHYSSNPEDLKKIVHSSTNEQIDTSVTPKNKISLKHVRRISGTADDDVSFDGGDDNNSSMEMTRSVEYKVVRRGSVKELSEKFVQKENAKSAEKSAYPKAGLILRTQSSRESTPGASSLRSGSADFDDCDMEIRATQSETMNAAEFENENVEYRTTSTRTSSQSKDTRSFLNSSGAKVQGVQDVLDRMRNADNGTMSC